MDNALKSQLFSTTDTYVRSLPKGHEPIFGFALPTDQLLICLHQKQSTYKDLWSHLYGPTQNAFVVLLPKNSLDGKKKEKSQDLPCGKALTRNRGKSYKVFKS